MSIDLNFGDRKSDFGRIGDDFSRTCRRPYNQTLNTLSKRAHVWTDLIEVISNVETWLTLSTEGLGRWRLCDRTLGWLFRQSRN